MQQAPVEGGPIPSCAMRRMTVMAPERSPRRLCSRSSRNSERRSGCSACASMSARVACSTAQSRSFRSLKVLCRPVLASHAFQSCSATTCKDAARQGKPSAGCPGSSSKQDGISPAVQPLGWIFAGWLQRKAAHLQRRGPRACRGLLPHDAVIDGRVRLQACLRDTMLMKMHVHSCMLPWPCLPCRHAWCAY